MGARSCRVRRGGPSARPAGRRPAMVPLARPAAGGRAGGPRAWPRSRPYDGGGVRLQARPDGENDAIVRLLMPQANDLSPPFLFELARRLWDRDRDAALEWFSVAVIRGQYDARHAGEPEPIDGSVAAARERMAGD